MATVPTIVTQNYAFFVPDLTSAQIVWQHEGKVTNRVKPVSINTLHFFHYTDLDSNVQSEQWISKFFVLLSVRYVSFPSDFWPMFSRKILFSSILGPCCYRILVLLYFCRRILLRNTSFVIDTFLYPNLYMVSKWISLWSTGNYSLDFQFTSAGCTYHNFELSYNIKHLLLKHIIRNTTEDKLVYYKVHLSYIIKVLALPC